MITRSAIICMVSVITLIPAGSGSRAWTAEPTDSSKSMRFPALSNKRAWNRLPREEPPLPVWARMLVPSLPKTTAAMLQLDYVHRAKNPLDPILRGKLRWVAADANRCAYGKAYAEADLRRAGLSEKDLKMLAGDHQGLSQKARAVLTFARKMTTAAHTVSDEEMAELIEQWGAETVVGMVHTLAHANFQDRIFLALGVEVEADGPYPPREYHFDMSQDVKLPKRPAWETIEGAKVAASGERPDWLERNFSDLQQALDRQKARASRIPPPTEEQLAKLPPEARGGNTRIVWTRISMGYQPMLTKAWFDCMRTFQRESQLNRVFSNTMFWVITRSNECFY